MAAAKEAPRGREAFDKALPAKLRRKDTWWQAARTGLELPAAHLPERTERSYPPPHKLWSKKYPEVSERYQLVRAAAGQRAEDLEMPPENLLQPAVLRQWVWEHEQAPHGARARRAAGRARSPALAGRAGGPGDPSGADRAGVSRPPGCSVPAGSCHERGIGGTELACAMSLRAQHLQR